MNTANVFKKFCLLDVLRGIAMLWIVIYHFLTPVSDIFGRIVGTVIQYGYLGVPVFFVISGYGISASIANSDYHSRPFAFLKSRFKRIYVVYWWSLLFTGGLIPFLHSLALSMRTHAFDLTSPYFPNYTFIEWLQVASLTKTFTATSWALNESFDPLNGPIWFLAIIVQVYLFVSITLLSKRHFNNLLLGGFFLSLLVNIPFFRHYLPYGLFLPYFAQFYIGIILYRLLKSDRYPKRTYWSPVIFLSLGLLFCFCNSYYNYLNSLLFGVLTGFVLLIGKKYDTRISNFTIARFFTLIGSFSFSIYLVHYPLRILSGMVRKNMLFFLEIRIQYIVEIMLVIVLSYFWYLLFEKRSFIHRVASMKKFSSR